MNQAVEKLLAVARAEIGVKENPAGSNKVKYNTWFYGREVSGSSYAWCAVFICWYFQQAGLRSLVKITGGCTTMMKWFRGNGQTIDPKSAQPGDLVFYQFDTDAYADHIGIVESVTKNGVIAIEGNTSLASNDNGGAVMRRERNWSQIMAVARPKWPEEEPKVESKEENGMTIETTQAGQREPSPWAREAAEWCTEEGLLQGDGEGDFGWQRAVTRQELAVVLYRLKTRSNAKQASFQVE